MKASKVVLNVRFVTEVLCGLMNPPTHPRKVQTMSDMVEKIARAMWESNTPYSDQCSWDFGKGPTHMIEESKDKWRGFAVVAIEAMREPTGIMCAAFNDSFPTEEGETFLKDIAPVVFNAMIDAALANKGRGDTDA